MAKTSAAKRPAATSQIKSRIRNPKSRKYVYFFGGGKADGNRNMKDLLGGKGAGLAEMTNLGISVPAGFTITTEACIEYYRRKKMYPPGLWDEALHALKKVERSMGMRFGDPTNPLLVSVRSGARASMPGMMDTVLNVGLNDRTVKASRLKRKMNDSPWTATGASSRCSGISSWAFIGKTSRTSSRGKNPSVARRSIRIWTSRR